jgi:hypothetical protein
MDFRKCLFNGLIAVCAMVSISTLKVEASDRKAYYLPDCGIFEIDDDYELEYHEIDSEKCSSVVNAWNNDPYREICGMPLETMLLIKQNATQRSIVDEYMDCYKAEISDEEYYADIKYLISLKEALADPAFAEAYRVQAQAEKEQKELQKENERQMYLANGEEVMRQIEPLREWANSVVSLGDYKPGSVYGPKLNQSELNEVEEAVKLFVGEYITSDMSDLDKIMTINEYLSMHCVYAVDWSKNRANTAWGALVYHEAQCSGYARATKALCDAVGIPCYYIHADNGDHQWNKVMIEGEWYIVDITNTLTCMNMLFLVSDEGFTAITGYTSDNSGIPIAENSYGYNIWREMLLNAD